MAGERKPPEPRYLGDGVYAKFDGMLVWLLTGSHLESEADNKVALEPAVYNALVRFWQDAWQLREEGT